MSVNFFFFSYIIKQNVFPKRLHTKFHIRRELIRCTVLFVEQPKIAHKNHFHPHHPLTAGMYPSKILKANKTYQMLDEKNNSKKQKRQLTFGHCFEGIAFFGIEFLIIISINYHPQQ